MKILLTVVTGLLVTTASNANATQKDNLCTKRAEKIMNKYFDSYVEQTREELIAEAKENEVDFSEDDVPGGLELSETRTDGNRETFTYSWGERQECACGVDVVGKINEEKKTCISVRVNYKSQSCECG